MTVYRTCRICIKRKGCDIKSEIGKKISGLGITSIKHKCDSYTPPFSPGEHVIATTYCDLDVGDECGELHNSKFNAVFIEQSGTKALVWIKPRESDIYDDVQFTPMKNNRGFCKLTFDRLEKATDIKFTPICKVCYGPEGTCDGNDNLWSPWADCPHENKLTPAP